MGRIRWASANAFNQKNDEDKNSEKSEKKPIDNNKEKLDPRVIKIAKCMANLREEKF